jgi:hypothetical protein
MYKEGTDHTKLHCCGVVKKKKKTALLQALDRSVTTGGLAFDRMKATLNFLPDYPVPYLVL